MATVIVHHTPCGGPADPLSLVDGPTYDADPHVVTGLENVPNIDTTNANNITLGSQTGTGAMVRATSPTLVTPILGVAAATSINGNIWTVGTGTLTLGAGKTATVSNTLTFTGTDGSIAAFGVGGTVAYKGTDLSQFAATTSLQLKGVISDETGSGALVFATSPSLVTPVLDVATATSINKYTFTTPAAAATLTILNNKTATFNNSLTLAGTDGTTLTFQGTDTYIGRATTDTLTNKTFDTAGAGNSFSINGVAATANTGTGSVVRATSPVLVTPALGTPASGVLTSCTGYTVANLADVAWTAYTPSSAFTTPGTSVMGTANGRWKQIGKTVFFSIDCICTTVGTGTGSWTVGLPTATAANQIVGASGKEVITLGVLLAAQSASTTTINVVKYDNTSLALGGNGTRIVLLGSYEAA